jgi:hypothetical protein
MTLLSALGSGVGTSAAGVAGTVGGVTTGEAAATLVAGREGAVVVVGRASFAAGGVEFTGAGEDAGVTDVEVRDAFSVDGAAATVVDEEVAVVGGEGRASFSPDGTVVTVVPEVITVDEGEAADVVSTIVPAAAFVGAAEFAVAGTGVVVFAGGADVTVAGGVDKAFDDDVAPSEAAGVMVAVTGGVRDAVIIGGAGATDGTVSVITRF